MLLLAISFLILSIVSGLLGFSEVSAVFLGLLVAATAAGSLVL